MILLINMCYYSFLFKAFRFNKFFFADIILNKLNIKILLNDDKLSTYFWLVK
jgi:hypothetical protein